MHRRVSVVLVLLLIFILMLKTTPTLNAFSNDINACLFDYWATGINAVLSGKVQCGGSQLCYGTAKPAQFAVCYSTVTLIPEFTGHIVAHNLGGAGRQGWHDENGAYAPPSQSSVKDYKNTQDSSLQVTQDKLFKNFDVNKEQFCSRGHLVPCADFTAVEDRKRTMINTNIAPQWQAFNNKNWAAVERAVREYAKSVSRNVYVVTGTGGQAKLNGNDIKLNNKVVVPKYYWTAICDPDVSVKKSVVFVAENPIDVIDVTTKVTDGCEVNDVQVQQTPKMGIVHCLSVNDFKTQYGFAIPDFHITNCDTKTRGEFMDAKLKFA